MKKPKWIKCSHKAIEWREWKRKMDNGERGISMFLPDRFCFECAESKKRKL